MKLKNQMGVCDQRRIRRMHSQSARHAEVNVELFSGGERENDTFSTPIDVGNGLAGESGGQIDVRGCDDVLAIQSDARNGLAQQAGPKGVDDSLNFGEFRHNAPGDIIDGTFIPEMRRVVLRMQNAPGIEEPWALLLQPRQTN